MFDILRELINRVVFENTVTEIINVRLIENMKESNFS